MQVRRTEFITALSSLLLIASSALAQAPGQRSAVIASDCDYSCLVGFVRSYMDALARKDPSRVHFARHVRFTENNVEMPLGNDGLWATVSGVSPNGLEAADAITGEAAWIGTVAEHGLPVYYGMRLKVQQREIVEVETIVVRNTGLPLPFGDVTKLVHDPSFAQVMVPGQRRPRERLIAVADSYFNTVELNDGMVFAPFDDDCARIENGIHTTRAGTASAGAIAQGCEEQLKLGIYRINKRIRERRYPLVDVERGVVVATAFFDHANEFDTYRTTDGKERKTLLKWPNSISLVEAFKIRDGRIYRIEAVFTYVPYFMHSPFFAYPSLPRTPRAASGTNSETCDRTCLIDHAEHYMDALVQHQPERLPWADEVRFTENSVPMMIGDGLWGSVRGRSSAALRVADPTNGTAAWFGTVNEHDAAAYFGMRLKVHNNRIAEVETVVARARNPGPFGDPAALSVDGSFDALVPADERSSREHMIALIRGYSSTAQLPGSASPVRFSARCIRVENGMTNTQGDKRSTAVAKTSVRRGNGCEAQWKAGIKPVDLVRGHRIIAVDEERGIIVTLSYEDHAARQTRYTTAEGQALETADRYPSTRELFELFKLRNGRIERIEAISVFQPYRMPSPWME